MKKTFRVLSILCLWVLSACASPTQAPLQFPTFILVTQDPNASPTPTPFQPSSQDDTLVPSFTPAPAASATFTASSTPQPTLTPLSPTQPPPAANTTAPQPSTSSRANYILYAELDFDARTIAVDETIRYYNNTGTALSDIVLSVQPNRYGNSFIL